jgi:signal transduction histidine kinase
MQTIATELHDNIGQLLSLTSVTLNSINIDYPTKAVKKIEDSLSLLNTSIKELRDLAKLFHGENLIEMGLANALAHEVNWLSKTDRFQLTISNNLSDIRVSSPAKDLIILRILQEIINNIIKHAQATKISIDSSVSEGIFQLQITDDGIGYDHTLAIEKKNGMGLHSLQKRTTLIGGKIAIKTSAGKGTCVHIEIPYP